MNRHRCHALFAAACALLATGCAGLYFDRAAPPAEVVRYELERWPYAEYWTGLVFNGDKIGFSHLAVHAEDDGLYRLDSQATFRLRFLGLEKSISVVNVDFVRPDLSLVRFDYRFEIDGQRMSARGEVHDGTLVVRSTTGAGTETETHRLAGPVVPASALPLVPLQRGLAVGRRWRYTAYSGELRQLVDVEQSVDAYETSRLFEGAAFKVTTRMGRHSSTIWIGSDGRPRLEIAMNGVLIAGLEDADRARRYLALASLNKNDTLIDFSRVRADRPIEEPRRLQRLELRLYGLGGLEPAAGPGQQCRREPDGAVHCVIEAGGGLPAAQETVAAYRAPSLAAPSGLVQIQNLAREIAGDAPTASGRIERLLAWLDAHIEKAPVDVFTALDVLERRKAECQGHAYLYTALARALGIPTRIVNGLVYSEEHGGFLYHSWAESWVDENWVAIDPTFGQYPADATHIKLLEGERPGELAPLVEIVGRVEVEIAGTRP